MYTSLSTQTQLGWVTGFAHPTKPAPITAIDFCSSIWTQLISTLFLYCTLMCLCTMIYNNYYFICNYASVYCAHACGSGVLCLHIPIAVMYSLNWVHHDVSKCMYHASVAFFVSVEFAYKRNYKWKKISTIQSRNLFAKRNYYHRSVAFSCSGVWQKLYTIIR